MARYRTRYRETATGCQHAGVRFSAFNQSTTPELTGEITAISPSTTTSKETGLTYYKAKVNIPEQELARLGDERLIPGMPVEVFFVPTAGDKAVPVFRPAKGGA